MIIISSNDLQIITSTAAMLKRNLKDMSPEDRKTAKAFCTYAENAEARYQEDKEKHREQMRRYRTDPKTADKAREQTREASRRFREKRKAAAE